MSTINPASVAILARRLRYLRRHPNPYTCQAQSEQIRPGMAMAYEYALRVLIDEFSLGDDFHSLFYGPQGEDPDVDRSILGN